MKNRLLIIVPAYNEVEQIQEVLDSIKKFITKEDNILAIDDGSTDGTLEVIKEQDIMYISHPHNLGKGAAIHTGVNYFLEHEYDIAIFIDADGQHDPSHIPKFIQFFERTKVDIILANRFATSTWKSNMPFTRKVSNLLSRFGLWLLYNRLFIPDPQNGYRGFRRNALENIPISANRYEAETEMIINGYLQEYKFGFISIESIYQPYHRTSKFSLVYDTWSIPKIMIQKFIHEKPWKMRKNHNPENAS